MNILCYVVLYVVLCKEEWSNFGLRWSLIVCEFQTSCLKALKSILYLQCYESLHSDQRPKHWCSEGPGEHFDNIQWTGRLEHWKAKIQILRIWHSSIIPLERGNLCLFLFFFLINYLCAFTTYDELKAQKVPCEGILLAMMTIWTDLENAPLWTEHCGW